MIRRLPPLNQLRAFEAAARHLSFKDAAEELHVTHAAVSHQIKALEAHLGQRLFHRGGRGVTLTEEAEKLAGELSRALDTMDTALRHHAAQTGQGQITISIVPWYANRVLLPRLPKFHADNPGIRVKFDFSYGLVDLEKSGIDAALRHGRGNWSNLVARRVHDEVLSPVCAPSLVAGQPLPLGRDGFCDLTLAVAKGHEAVWHAFFDLAGWEFSSDLRTVEFENRAVATEFAIAGHGVALSDIVVTGDEVRSGQLTLLSDLRLRPDTGGYLVFPAARENDERLIILAEWMRDAFGDLPIPSLHHLSPRLESRLASK